MKSAIFLLVVYIVVCLKGQEAGKENVTDAPETVTLEPETTADLNYTGHFLDVKFILPSELILRVFPKSFGPNTELQVRYKPLEDSGSKESKVTLQLDHEAAIQEHHLKNLQQNRRYQVCGEVLHEGQVLETCCIESATYRILNSKPALATAVAAAAVFLGFASISFAIYKVIQMVYFKKNVRITDSEQQVGAENKAYENENATSF